MSENNLSRWVDGRLEALNVKGAWRPDAGRTLARLKARRARRRRFMWGSAMAATIACVCFLMLVAQPACANPYCAGFMKPAAVQSTSSQAATAVPTPKPIPAPVAKPKPIEIAAAAPPPTSQKAPALVTNFKESGSLTAPLVCEIYSDYECPACAVLFRDIVPRLMADYVRTGKMKLIHRDFPLPAHPYARLAARFANAAGALGYYDIVVAQIFKTQEFWNKNGDIDAQVALVVPPGMMQKLRQMVRSDNNLESTVESDRALGVLSQINQTPTIVIIKDGKRQKLPPSPTYNLLQMYLNQLLGSR